MNTEYAVELEHINKVYHTRHFFYRDEETGRRRWYTKKTVHAAVDVNFGIRPGEIFGLLGPNGAGKTSCVKMISGLVRPTSGNVYVEGLHVEKKRLQVLRRIGVVLEGTRTVIWPLTPLENLNYFGNLRGIRGKILKERARQLLDFIGLKDKMNVQVRRLSRGQRQKLAICIALIADPSVILLDEPTTGLDVQSSHAIREKIREMTRAFSKSVLVTTHDMFVAQDLCDRIGIIDKGKLIACKTTPELLDVFSDKTFEFRLDRMPDPSRFASIHGVQSIALDENCEGPVLVVSVEQEETVRSAALYEIISRLRDEGYLLKSVTLRQQTLENVFLRLTESTTPSVKPTVSAENKLERRV